MNTPLNTSPAALSRTSLPDHLGTPPRTLPARLFCHLLDRGWLLVFCFAFALDLHHGRSIDSSAVEAPSTSESSTINETSPAVEAEAVVAAAATVPSVLDPDRPLDDL